MSPWSTSRATPSPGSSPCPSRRPSTAPSITGSGGGSRRCSPTSRPGASGWRTASSVTRSGSRACSWSLRWRCTGRCPPACGRPRVSPCRPKKSPGATGAEGGPRPDLPLQAWPAPHPTPPAVPRPAPAPLERLAELMDGKPLRFQGGLDRHRRHGAEDLPGDGGVDPGTAEPQAARQPQHQVGAVATVDGTSRGKSRVRDRQTPAAAPAGQDPGEQGPAAATRLRAADPAVGVGGELRLVPLELRSIDVALVVPLQQHLPRLGRPAVAVALARATVHDRRALLAFAVDVRPRVAAR